jgi:hypothetical protein
MHVKYGQDNLHCMTWYTSTYGSNGHGLTIHVSFIVKCMCYTRLWIYWFRDHGATITNSLVTIGRTSLVGVGHLCSYSIVPLMLRITVVYMICIYHLLYIYHV